MKTKIFLSFIMSAIFALFVGVAASMAIPVNPVVAGTAFFTVRTFYLFVLKGEQYSGLFLAGVNQEIWIETLKENFYSQYPWLEKVDDWSEWVEYNTINFAAVGSDPVILKNNSSWPIVAAQRTDTALTVVLDTYDSTTTRVRRVEEIEAAPKKLESVIKQHKQSLIQAIVTEVLWNYGPATAAAGAVAASGANRAAVIGSQTTVAAQLQLDDLAALQERWDNLEFNHDGRVVVLNPYHVRDLIKQDVSLHKSFTDQTKDAGSQGGLAPIHLYGFEIYSVGNTPLYTKSTLAKKAFGAGADNTNDCIASVAFNVNEVMKCMGDTFMFYRPLENNPEQRADEIGFQQRFKGVPMRTTNFFQQAIVSNRA